MHLVKRGTIWVESLYVNMVLKAFSYSRDLSLARN